MIWFLEAFGDWSHFSRSLKSESFALKVMLGEALAVACECLAQAEAKTSIHSAFIQMGLYTFDTSERPRIIRRLRTQTGVAATLRFLALVLLYSGFLYQSLTPKQSEELLSLSFGSRRPKEIQDKIPLFLNRLSIGFRLRTTRLYFRSLGFSEPVTRILKRDPLEQFEQSPAIQRALERVIQDLSQG